MTHEPQQLESKTIFGFWLYLLSDIILFGVFFVTYAILRKGTAGDLHAGQLIALPKALLETFLILASSFLCGLSKNRPLPFLAMSFLLGVLFFGLVTSDLLELVQTGHGWGRSAFLSAYFLLLGVFLMHVAAALLWMLVLMACILWHKSEMSIHRRLHCLQMFCHFLNIVWVGIYSWIYLMGSVI